LVVQSAVTAEDVPEEGVEEEGNDAKAELLMPSQQLQTLLQLSEQMQGAAGPSNAPGVQVLLSTFLQAFQQQQASNHQTLQALKEQNGLLQQQMAMEHRRDAQRASSSKVLEQTSRQVLLNIPVQQPKKGEKHRKCGVFRRDPGQCKGVERTDGKKNSPRGTMLSILSINDAREKDTEEEVPVFLRAASTLGYRLNQKSDLFDSVVCADCSSVDFAIPVTPTNPKVCCVICKVVAGVDAVRWNPANVLCADCKHSPAETKLMKPLQRLVEGLNRVVKPHPYDRRLEIFQGSVAECKVYDKHWVDALILVSNAAGDVVAAVVLEIDGNEHSGSQYDREFERNADIVKCMRERYKEPSKILFVRMNPNKDVSVKVDKSERQEKLKIPILGRLLVLQSWLLAASLDPQLFPDVAMLYLFYGHDNKRLWPNSAQGQQGQNSKDAVRIWRLVTHRAVRPGWKGKGAVWWRYLPDPATPLQLKKHLGVNNPFELEKCERLEEGGGPFKFYSRCQH
jgi:hypothetical protein